jgi:hypothetical protein
VVTPIGTPQQQPQAQDLTARDELTKLGLGGLAATGIAGAGYGTARMMGRQFPETAGRPVSQLAQQLVGGLKNVGRRAAPEFDPVASGMAKGLTIPGMWSTFAESVGPKAGLLRPVGGIARFGLKSAPYIAADIASHHVANDFLDKKVDKSGLLGDILTEGAGGAMLGSGIGSMVPGLGTGVGAVVGGGLGAVHAIMGGGKPHRSPAEKLADAMQEAKQEVVPFLQQHGVAQEDIDAIDQQIAMLNEAYDATGDKAYKVTPDMVKQAYSSLMEQVVSGQYQPPQGALDGQKVMQLQALAGHFMRPYMEQFQKNLGSIGGDPRLMDTYSTIGNLGAVATGMAPQVQAIRDLADQYTQYNAGGGGGSDLAALLSQSALSQQG